MRKEYNNRAIAKIVNPGVSFEEYEASKEVTVKMKDEDLQSAFENMLSILDEEQKTYFSKVVERSRANNGS